MWKLNKIWSFIENLFVKKVDQDKLFSDIFSFMKTQPKIDYRKLKREGKDIFKYKYEDGGTGEQIEYGHSNLKFISEPKLAIPQPIVPIDREYDLVSSQVPAIKQNNLYMISADDMQREIEIEEEYNVKNPN